MNYLRRLIISFMLMIEGGHLDPEGSKAGPGDSLKNMGRGHYFNNELMMDS
jgi:hypothetical protein